MPRQGRKPTPQTWKTRVYELRGQGMSAREIYDSFEQEGTEDYPSFSIVRKLVTEFNKMNPDDQREYREFSWPQSMEAGIVPWEAGHALLDLLVKLRKEHKNRPLNRNARWFWRITLAAPDAPIHTRWVFACSMALLEVRGKLSEQEETAAVQWYLAFAPWRSGGARKEYVEAILDSWKAFYPHGGQKPFYTGEPIQNPKAPVLSRDLDKMPLELEAAFGLALPQGLRDAIETFQRLQSDEGRSHLETIPREEALAKISAASDRLGEELDLWLHANEATRTKADVDVMLTEAREASEQDNYPVNTAMPPLILGRKEEHEQES